MSPDMSQDILSTGRATSLQTNSRHIEATALEATERGKGSRRLRLFKQQVDGLFYAVFEQHGLIEREKDQKIGERGRGGESRLIGCVNIRLMVCSAKSMCSTDSTARFFICATMRFLLRQSRAGISHYSYALT